VHGGSLNVDVTQSHDCQPHALNPYSPPTTETRTIHATGAGVRGRRGPALYISGDILLGGFGAIPILVVQESTEFALVVAGCMAGWGFSAFGRRSGRMTQPSAKGNFCTRSLR